MPKPKILLIDDEYTTTKLVSFVLQREGYDVLVAGNSAEAFRAVREDEPDLVILDIMLPGMNGYEICYQLRTDSGLNSLPILMFTARDLPADQRKGFGVGADDYVTKPINSAELLSRVRSMLFFRLPG